MSRDDAVYPPLLIFGRSKASGNISSYYADCFPDKEVERLHDDPLPMVELDRDNSLEQLVDIFKRLEESDLYPPCSWLLAHVFQVGFKQGVLFREREIVSVDDFFS